MKHFRDYTVLGGESPAALRHTATNPLVATFRLDKGLITWAGFYYPPGPRGCVYAQLLFQEHQILPRDPGFWCHGENGWWAGDLYFPVTAAPLKCKVIMYEDNCNFNHTITLGLELKPWHMVAAWDRILMVWEGFADLLGLPTKKGVIREYTP